MSRYLDTTRLRQVIADGHNLAKTTVLDLLTRLERYQDAELQQLAKEPTCSCESETIPGLRTNHYPDPHCAIHAPQGAAIVINPDCRDGKHRSCSNVGWNTATDGPDYCPCHCHQEDV